MAECKNCHTTIPDGNEYCEECELKRNKEYNIFDDSQDDSYFDELLQQEMQNEASQTESGYDLQEEEMVSVDEEAIEKDLNQEFQNIFDSLENPETEDVSPAEEPSMEEDSLSDGNESFVGQMDDEIQDNQEQIDQMDDEMETMDPDALNMDDISSLSDLSELPEIPELEMLQQGSSDEGELDDIEGVLASIESGEFERDLMEMLSEEPGSDDGETAESNRKKKKNEKKGFLKTIFGNVVEELSEEEKAKRRKEALEEAEREKQRAIDRKNKAKISKAEKKEKKKQEAADKKVSAAAAKAVKAEAAKKKKEEAAGRAKAKKEEKAARLAVIEVEEDVGRINRIGSVILIVVFAALAVFILYGSDIYTYNNKIESAATNFERQRYNEAYDDVYGLNVKDKDRDIYDKIMTVMFVNKQLNSYNNFYAIGLYAEALDSLLKGLERYDKYIEFAKSIGIQSDLDHVRSQIAAELYNVYKLDESKALELISIKEQPDYTMALYEITGTNK